MFRANFFIGLPVPGERKKSYGRRPTSGGHPLYERKLGIGLGEFEAGKTCLEESYGIHDVVRFVLTTQWNQ